VSDRDPAASTLCETTQTSTALSPTPMSFPGRSRPRVRGVIPIVHTPYDYYEVLKEI